MIYLELFYVFFIIGLFTFGGGYAMIPLIESETVGRGWIEEETFRRMIAIAESTPGPIAINMATFVGNTTAGFLGAFISTIGVTLPSFIIILLIATVMKHLIDKPVVKAILHGFQGIVIGLIFATAFYFLYQDVVSLENGTYTFLIIPAIIFAIILVGSIIFKMISKKSVSPYIILIAGGLLGLLMYSLF